MGTVVAYLFFTAVFLIFAGLLAVDIIKANAPVGENKRVYNKSKGQARTGTRGKLEYFGDSMAGATPLAPVTQRGLFVGEIVSDANREKRRMTTASGSFAEYDSYEEIQTKANKPEKTLADFFGDIKPNEDYSTGKAVDARGVLFDDYKKLGDDSASRFLSNLNTQRDIKRSGAADMPFTVSSAPDIQGGTIEFGGVYKPDSIAAKPEPSPLKKSENKLEVVFHPQTDEPQYLVETGDIINGERYSGYLKNSSATSYGSASGNGSDRSRAATGSANRVSDGYYDSSYNFEDKAQKVDEFLGGRAQSAPIIKGHSEPDYSDVSASSYFNTGASHTADSEGEDGNIFNCDSFDGALDEEVKNVQHETNLQNTNVFTSFANYIQTSSQQIEIEKASGADDSSASIFSDNQSKNQPADTAVNIQPRQPIFEMPVSLAADNQKADKHADAHKSDSFCNGEPEYNIIAENDTAIETSSQIYEAIEAQAEEDGLDLSFSKKAIKRTQKEGHSLKGVKESLAKTEEYSKELQAIEALEAGVSDEESDEAGVYTTESKVSFESSKFNYDQNYKDIEPDLLKEHGFAVEADQDKSDNKEDYTGHYIKSKGVMQVSESEFTKRSSSYKSSKVVKDQISIDGIAIDSASALSQASSAASSVPKKRKRTKYVPPPIELLHDLSTDPTDYGGDHSANSEMLEETLKSLGLPVEVIDVTPGPAVTRYELKMPRGIPIKKILNYGSDIAYALASKKGVRIEAPIPDKSAVGVEVPNREIGVVGLKDLIASDEFKKSHSNLTLCVGKDIAGKAIYCSLEKMPHLLVAGSTNSGKSACLNSMIVSMIYKSSPQDLRLILIDPKRVEFPFYKNLPHLLINQIINEREHAINAFKWIREEMSARYKLLQTHGVRNLQEFNMSAAVKGGEVEKLPSIVVIVDELSDLMAGGYRKEMEEHILSIAQLARAAGIHLILSTQRPSVDVITGTIKVNLPSRIAFAVTNAVDSKTILDQSGAEMLLGRGDLLYAPIEEPEPKRIQGAYITKEEIEEIIRFVRENNSGDYYDAAEGIIMKEKEPEVEAGEMEDDEEAFDPLLEEVARKVIETNQVSTSMLQRRFKLGYARASRLVDLLEHYKFIGPMDVNRPTKPREIFITREAFKDFFGKDY